MQVYQQFDIDIVPPALNFNKNQAGVFVRILQICSASNFIKNKTQACVLSHEFWEVFQPKTVLKTRVGHRCNFCKIFKDNYFAEHLQRAHSNDMIIDKFFYDIYFSLKWKMNRYQR